MFTFSSQFNGSVLTSAIGLLPSHLVLVKLMNIFSNSPSRDDFFPGIARDKVQIRGTFQCHGFFELFILAKYSDHQRVFVFGIV